MATGLKVLKFGIFLKIRYVLKETVRAQAQTASLKRVII